MTSRIVLRAAALAVAAWTLTACRGLLDVSNPTLVRESDIANADGANAKRLNVLDWLQQTAGPLAGDVAILTDEWTINLPATDFVDPLDIRNSQAYETAQGTIDRHLGGWDRVFYQTSMAIPAVRSYTPDSLRGDFLGQLYAVRGYAVLQLAEDMCPGFPLNDVTADNQPIFSGPLTTDSALAYASVQLDSAVKYAADSVRIVTLARVAKGRALLDQGKYAEAAAVVATVPTPSTYDISFVGNLSTKMRRGSAFIVGDREGGNGIPFVSQNDVRIPIFANGHSAIDPTVTVYKTSKYPTAQSSMTLASGVEARLIEAEAALNAGDPNWLTILNTLRATAGLAALSDPGTTTAQVDLLYQERAFWLYLTGRRLGDLRRLIKNYGRSPESVFPTGAYTPGGTYNTATAIPFILQSDIVGNPYLTTGCTTR